MQNTVGLCSEAEIKICVVGSGRSPIARETIPVRHYEIGHAAKLVRLVLFDGGLLPVHPPWLKRFVDRFRLDRCTGNFRFRVIADRFFAAFCVTNCRFIKLRYTVLRFALWIDVCFWS
jgi:hypothetical protein